MVGADATSRIPALTPRRREEYQKPLRAAGLSRATLEQLMKDFVRHRATIGTGLVLADRTTDWLAVKYRRDGTDKPVRATVTEVARALCKTYRTAFQLPSWSRIAQIDLDFHATDPDELEAQEEAGLAVIDRLGRLGLRPVVIWTPRGFHVVVLLDEQVAARAARTVLERLLRNQQLLGPVVEVVVGDTDAWMSMPFTLGQTVSFWHDQAPVQLKELADVAAVINRFYKLKPVAFQRLGSLSKEVRRGRGRPRRKTRPIPGRGVLTPFSDVKRAGRSGASKPKPEALVKSGVIGKLVILDDAKIRRAVLEELDAEYPAGARGRRDEISFDAGRDLLRRYPRPFVESVLGEWLATRGSTDFQRRPGRAKEQLARMLDRIERWQADHRAIARSEPDPAELEFLIREHNLHPSTAGSVVKILAAIRSRHRVGDTMPMAFTWLAKVADVSESSHRTIKKLRKTLSELGIVREISRGRQGQGATKVEILRVSLVDAAPLARPA